MSTTTNSIESRTAELYREREQRIEDAIALRRPDRVPAIALLGSFPARYGNITYEEEANDVEKCLAANFAANLDFQPDAVVPSPTLTGSVLGAVDYKQMKWAGHGLPPDVGYQAVENEWMKAEEYDELLYDPSDFIVRKYWPRVYGKLGILSSLPPLHQIIGYFAAPMGFAAWGLPGAVEALEALRKAGEEGLLYLKCMAAHVQQLKSAGLPMFFLAGSEAPFDFLGDFLRGRKAVMLDMYRRPEKLLAATEKLLPMAIETGVMGARMSGNSRVFIAIHGGIENFMSLEQYKKFYWPGLRDLMRALIAQGLTPVVLVEGGSRSRLEAMKDVPAGKVCYIFEDVDMSYAKQVLGETACIAGNVPLALLAKGTPEQVRAYCRKLIDTAGRDGGYILSSAGSMDDAHPQNIRAMIQTAQEYGTY